MRGMVPFGGSRNSIFDEMDEVFRGFSDAIRPMTRRFVPVDLYEEGDELFLSVDAPGFDPSQIEIKTFSDRVDIRSKAEGSEEGPEERVWHIRRPARGINLGVSLPTEVDPEQARASFKNGVITVRMPKSRAVQGRVLELREE
ncbi:MAG TPA: Hsp20/alpha crystallin family protein [Thermovirgaceae bacterium]|nr:Hsp20/alpha crystallin family protein [Thermovirgaceae bacterium]